MPRTITKNLYKEIHSKTLKTSQRNLQEGKENKREKEKKREQTETQKSK